MITWDEAKRQANIKRHGIDFAGCEPIFDYPLVTVEDKRKPYGGQRLQSLGFLNRRVVFMVWVERQEAAHLISVREATKHETRTFGVARNTVSGWLKKRGRAPAAERDTGHARPAGTSGHRLGVG